MTTQGPVIAGSVQRLVSHKDYTIEMVNLIIKEANLDGSGEHSIEDLGAFCLFDLYVSWPYFFFLW